ncbi:sugar phosphate nucleotidyltransferase [Candidatus Aminicenantes bacterium AC-334-K16]|jgi:mannose-1-phosphate guanylyltransferase|nr:sugar phosphate nucleotidyltransferase [Candidatus Aminicenantes bacterium AC-334-K16]
MDKLYVVIMAGGQGTRFWPFSRRSQPKQFLPIISERTMLEETIARLHPSVPASRILTIANEEQTQRIRQMCPDLPQENLLIEPQGKNTAPSLLLATATLYLRQPQAVIAALPADHLIADPERFREKLAAAARAAQQTGSLITFGIPPTFPATGYGYIQFKQPALYEIQDESFYQVEMFKEKPDLETAIEFLQAGHYFWNSGMFIWQADVFAQQLAEAAPEMYHFWEKMIEALAANNFQKIKEIFQDIPAISIDYALMEKASKVLMTQGDFGWSDVGSWSSLLDVWPADEQGNAVRGEGFLLESSGCLLFSPHKFVALIGVKDLVVIDTKDALLICHKEQDQKVREVVKHLQKMGKKHLL